MALGYDSTCFSLVYIRENEKLHELCNKLRLLEFVSIDTEFVRVSTFFPKAGLIQLSDGETCYLLDPLELSDWDSFVDLLKNPSVIKVLHSCSEDLLLLQHFLGVVPDPIFDTQKAAAFAGFGPSLSYQGLVKELLNIDIEKGETRSNWLRRPLTEEQISYAALDVELLPEIYRQLAARLESLGRTQWHVQECQDMRVNILAETEDNAWQQYYKNMGAPWKLETQPRRKLQALCQWREHTARRRDKPRGWVAKDTELVVLAENSPESVMELQKLDSLSASLVRRDGAKLVEILRAASEEVAGGKVSEIISLDIAKKPLTAASRNILKKCQAIVALKAAQLKIAPELLARKKQLVALINSRGESEVNFWPQELEGWRRALLETQIAEVLNVIE